MRHTCSDCVFATVTDDGDLLCVINCFPLEAETGCECWFPETYQTAGNQWFEVIEWPAQRKTRSS